MNNKSKNTGKNGVFAFICAILIALACFGVAAYLVVTYRGAEPVDETIVTITQIFALIGVFFLVLAFGHTLPMIISGKKSQGGTQITNQNDMFNEANMRIALEKYIPDGETMLAGIHAVAKESSVTCAFDKCILTEGQLVADISGDVVSVTKTKYSVYDLYICVTESYFVVADCEQYKYLYEFNKEPVSDYTDIQVLTSNIGLGDVGKCFKLDDIKNVTLKKGMLGSYNCVITMKNGSYFKLLLPTTGGLGGGMPNHAEYREKIINYLSRKSA